MNEAEEAARDAAYNDLRFRFEVPENEGAFKSGFVAGWPKAIAYAKREQQWIPVSEGLPDNDEFYLVFLRSFNRDGDLVGESYQVLCYFNEEWVDNHGLDREYSDVVAWQPFESYQPKTDGDLTIDALTKMTPTEIAALDWADVRRVLSGATDGDKAEGE